LDVVFAMTPGIVWYSTNGYGRRRRSAIRCCRSSSVGRGRSATGNNLFRVLVCQKIIRENPLVGMQDKPPWSPPISKDVSSFPEDALHVRRRSVTVTVTVTVARRRGCSCCSIPTRC
jgi:hypothetical protein